MWLRLQERVWLREFNKVAYPKGAFPKIQLYTLSFSLVPIFSFRIHTTMSIFYFIFLFFFMLYGFKGDFFFLFLFIFLPFHRNSLFQVPNQLFTLLSPTLDSTTDLFNNAPYLRISKRQNFCKQLGLRFQLMRKKLGFIYSTIFNWFYNDQSNES
jgi:hypothetical protein